MSNMSFMPQLKAFLKRNKIIYTVRKYKMADAMVEVDGIGECHRIPIGIIEKKEDLNDYVDGSGFSTVDEWWTKIKYFIPGSWTTKYIYKVEVEER